MKEKRLGCRGRKALGGLAAVLALAAVALAAGCTGHRNLIPPECPEPQAAAPRVEGAGDGFALVLGAGGVRGAGHIGVIEELEKRGLRPSLVVGTSAGAIVGALYASGLSAKEIEAKLASGGAGELLDYALDKRGAVKGEALAAKLEEWMREGKKAPIPFMAVATDLGSGSPAVFRGGSPRCVARAVQASAAIPGAFVPVEGWGRTFVDGGLAAAVPEGQAKEAGARIALVSDVLCHGRGGAKEMADNALDLAVAAARVSSCAASAGRSRVEGSVLVQPGFDPQGSPRAVEQAALAVASGRAAGSSGVERLASKLAEAASKGR